MPVLRFYAYVVCPAIMLAIISIGLWGTLAMSLMVVDTQALPWWCWFAGFGANALFLTAGTISFAREGYSRDRRERVEEQRETRRRSNEAGTEKSP